MACLWHTYDTTPEEEARLVERQVRWEDEAVNRGIDRYRKAIAEANQRAVERGNAGGVIETDVGSVILREIVEPMVPAIAQLQHDMVDSMTSAGRPHKAAIPLLSLEPDKWAVIVGRCALSGLAPELHDVRPATSLALQIASAGKLQREFDLWKERQKEESKAAASRGEFKADLYKVMLRKVKKVDARAARRWMKLSDDLDHLEWTKEQRVLLGMSLLKVLATHGGGWFEIVYIRRGTGRGTVTERVLQLTEHGRAFITQWNAQTELQRPWLLPMVCPPKAWRYDEEKAEAKRNRSRPANTEVQTEGGSLKEDLHTEATTAEV